MSKTMTAESRAHALKLISEAVARTSIGKVALHLTAANMKVSRTTLSLILSDKYPASPDHVFAAALKVLDRRHCPYVGAVVEAEYCRDTNTGPTPTWDPSALAQRRMCQTCPNRPQPEKEKP
jgi:hypothetical protein